MTYQLRGWGFGGEALNKHATMFVCLVFREMFDVAALSQYTDDVQPWDENEPTLRCVADSSPISIGTIAFASSAMPLGGPGSTRAATESIKRERYGYGAGCAC